MTDHIESITKRLVVGPKAPKRDGRNIYDPQRAAS